MVLNRLPIMFTIKLLAITSDYCQLMHRSVLNISNVVSSNVAYNSINWKPDIRSYDINIIKTIYTKLSQLTERNLNRTKH